MRWVEDLMGITMHLHRIYRRALLRIDRVYPGKFGMISL